MNRLARRLILVPLLLLMCSAVSLAQETTPPADAVTVAAPTEAAAPPVTYNFNGADIAWMLVSSALVLLMTAPGLALFYGGLVRKKNLLSVMMQCIMLMGVMSIVWALIGYSLVFSTNLDPFGFVGGFDYALLNGVQPTTGAAESPKYSEALPRSVHMVFQMMFFIITPGLICGAFAERMKFSSMMVFSVLWGLLVYCPVAHWVWSDYGWFSEFNATVVENGAPVLGKGAYMVAYDFAGGTVVHATSGLTALICALLIGKRLGFGQEPMPPHNLGYTFIGATLLWVGWFGFNAGSAGAANAAAANAFAATHLAAAAGAVAWAVMEWLLRGKPSILGACSGAVAGLVAITPACGTCTPISGILIGLAAGVVCYFACTTVKRAGGYDDSLDAFGVHGVGGVLGAILTGVFATKAVRGGADNVGLVDGNAGQVVNQAIAIGAAALLAVVGSFVLLKIIDLTMGLRVTQAAELEGLDISEHGEEGYIFS